MHANELVELAAVVALQGPMFIRTNYRVPPMAVQQYWSACRCRFDRWVRLLKSVAAEQEAPAWSQLQPVLNEILISDILTRVWGAVACAHDHRRGHSDLDPVVRSTLVNHREARNRTLNLMVYGRSFEVEDAVELNRVRRRSERWTDLLLGYLAADADVRDFAFDPQRAEQFAQEMKEQDPDLNDPANRLIMSSLRAAFIRNPTRTSNADLNSQVASAVLGCFDGNLFDSAGLPRSLFVERMSQVARDTEGMIEELLLLESADGDAPEPRRNLPSVRRFEG